MRGLLADALISLTTIVLSGCSTTEIVTKLSAVESPDAKSYFSSGWIVQEKTSDKFNVRLAVRDGRETFKLIKEDYSRDSQPHDVARNSR